MKAAWIAGAKLFLDEMSMILPIFLISGTPQEELRIIVERRNMSHFFTEILGSPVKKPEHIKWLLRRYHLNPGHCVFIGDASTDYHAASESNMPFIAIQGDYIFPEDVTVLPDCNMLKSAIARIFHV